MVQIGKHERFICYPVKRTFEMVMASRHTLVQNSPNEQVQMVWYACRVTVSWNEYNSMSADDEIGSVCVWGSRIATSYYIVISANLSIWNQRMHSRLLMDGNMVMGRFVSLIAFIFHIRSIWMWIVSGSLIWKVTHFRMRCGFRWIWIF